MKPMQAWDLRGSVVLVFALLTTQVIFAIARLASVAAKITMVGSSSVARQHLRASAAGTEVAHGEGGTFTVDGTSADSVNRTTQAASVPTTVVSIVVMTMGIMLNATRNTTTATGAKTLRLQAYYVLQLTTRLLLYYRLPRYELRELFEFRKDESRVCTAYRTMCRLECGTHVDQPTEQVVSMILEKCIQVPCVQSHCFHLLSSSRSLPSVHYPRSATTAWCQVGLKLPPGTDGDG